MKTFIETVMVVTLGVTAIVLAALLPAFLLMLGLGAAHDQWPVIPALGFWTTYLLLASVTVVTRTILPRTAVEED